MDLWTWTRKMISINGQNATRFQKLLHLTIKLWDVEPVDGLATSDKVSCRVRDAKVGLRTGPEGEIHNSLVKSFRKKKDSLGRRLMTES